MSRFFSRQRKAKGPLPSPQAFLEWAGFLTILFIIVNLAGLRDYTSVLNGTIGSTTLSWQNAAFLGAAYILVYLAFVLGAPILVIAAGILKLWEKAVVKKDVANESGSKAQVD